MLTQLKRDDTLDTDSVMEARFAILESALHRLETVCDPDAIRRAAIRLSAILHDHYELEQDPQSFFSEVLEIATHRQMDILRLRQEHGPILDGLNSLGQAAGEAATSLRPRALKLIGRIREHEALEAQAYFDGLYNDLGGMG